MNIYFFDRMNFTMDTDLLDSPEIVLQKLPLSDAYRERIASFRQEIISILNGNDPRILLLCGPCSIHNVHAALTYAKRLKALSDEVKDKFFVVMRAYVEKPRTSTGWKGLLYDPELDGSHNIQSGIYQSRQFLLELIKLDLPAGAEILDPLASYYISDLLSWGSIGARTVQSPIHRQLASLLPMAVGFKNTTDGNIEVAVQAALVAKMKHTFLGIDQRGRLCPQTGQGNSYPHIILRGGSKKENYDAPSILYATTLLQQADLPPGVIVDASHDNARKNFRKQVPIFSYLMDEIEQGNRSIRGIMLESFLLEATQEMHYKMESSYSKEDIAFGASLTDPCLDWQTTEAMIKQAYTKITSLSTVCL